MAYFRAFRRISVVAHPLDVTLFTAGSRSLSTFLSIRQDRKSREGRPNSWVQLNRLTMEDLQRMVVEYEALLEVKEKEFEEHPNRPLKY